MPAAAKKSPKAPAAAPAEAKEKKPKTDPAPNATTTAEEPQTSVTKPDQAAYNAEQERIKREIEVLQAKLTAVKEKISLTSKTGPSADRRTALRTELDSLRGQQATIKGSRGKLLDQVKAINENIDKKIKDLRAAKQKAPFKTVEEIDAQVKQLEKQVESGTLKLGDEKRALAEISSIKRSRKIVEGFQAEQDTIEADRARVEELRKQLDDPEKKAISDRFEAIKAELDEIKKEGDEAFADRNKLFDERNDLQAKLDTLFNQKRESAQLFRAAGDRYWQKVNEDRARRAEKLRATKLAEEEARKREISESLLEEARIPAYQTQIEDCQTLIDFFSGKPTAASQGSGLSAKLELAGIPKLELRKVEHDPTLVARKKKGEEDENFFVVSKKPKKGAAKPAPAPEPAATPAAPANTQVNVPLAILSALHSLSIPTPTSTSDVPRTIEDLKTKKAWFEANQARQTAENIAKAEAEIARLDKAAAEKQSKAKEANGESAAPADADAETTEEAAPAATEEVAA